MPRSRAALVALLATVLLTALPAVAIAAPTQFFSTSGALENSDPDQTGRITNGTGKTSCAAPTTATLNTATGERNFDAYLLANQLASPACIEVAADIACAIGDPVQLVSHLDAFNPADPLLNHLGDAGAGFSGTQTQSYGFTVPAGRRFVVKVNASDPGGTCLGGYALRVGSDPPQALGAPATVIGSGPSGDQASDQAAFAFSSNRPVISFECSLDNAAFAPCTSPAQYAGLAPGLHLFQVQAVDPNTDARAPALRAFNVLAPSAAQPGATTPGGSPSPGLDTTRPQLGVVLARTQSFRRGSIVLFLATDEPVTDVVTGRVNVPNAAVVRRFRRRQLSVVPGRIARVRLRMGRAGARRVRAALRRGRRLTARIAVRSTDRAGNASTAARRVRLRR